MKLVHAVKSTVDVRTEGEVLRIEPWGDDSFRVRVSRREILDSIPHALVSSATEASVSADEQSATLVNGRARLEVSCEFSQGYTKTTLQFFNNETGELVLSDKAPHFWWPNAREMGDDGTGYGKLVQHFAAQPDEKIFGLGQRTHGRLDQKGLVLDLVQRNAEVSIPFALSSRGYGFLWNSPAVGNVTFADNGTRWVSERARQIDYWVTIGGAPKEILSRYADATGHAPPLPDWATGFWQSKLRYKSQAELMEVAKEYRRRGLPLSVIVVDYFAWTKLGEWKFDPDEWPDPEGAIKELEHMGIKLMISIWPSVNAASENFDEMRARGLLLGRAAGQPFTATWTDKGNDQPMPVAFYDPTNPEARQFVWQKVKDNYFDLGGRVWWLDACEPEIRPDDHGTLAFHDGPGCEVANVYPREHARAFFEGMHDEGAEDVVLLCRSAWAGSQRFGAAVWSGDIGVDWENLQEQIRAGQNIAISGIPWWTTDIGGFHGGVVDNPEYQELVIRWFQFGVFCPLFRLHGFREPRLALGAGQTGGPNEVWSFGDEAYRHIVAMLHLRESLRGYVGELMQEASETGVPPMRALFIEFPDDDEAWQVDGQFMLGPDLLVAPVTKPSADTWRVYLPAGRTWTPMDGSECFVGGQWVDFEVDLSTVLAFVGDGAASSLEALKGQRS